MFNIQFSKDAQKFLTNLQQKKHSLQIKHKLQQLQIDAYPADCKQLKADLKGAFRVDVGEYRIIYSVDDKSSIIKIIVIGKRNDGASYKQASRKS